MNRHWKNSGTLVSLLLTLSLAGSANKPTVAVSEDHAGAAANQTIVDEWKTIVRRFICPSLNEIAGGRLFFYLLRSCSADRRIFIEQS